MVENGIYLVISSSRRNGAFLFYLLFYFALFRIIWKHFRHKFEYLAFIMIGFVFIFDFSFYSDNLIRYTALNSSFLCPGVYILKISGRFHIRSIWANTFKLKIRINYFSMRFNIGIDGLVLPVASYPTIYQVIELLLVSKLN